MVTLHRTWERRGDSAFESIWEWTAGRLNAPDALANVRPSRKWLHDVDRHRFVGLFKREQLAKRRGSLLCWGQILFQFLRLPLKHFDGATHGECIKVSLSRSL